MTVPGKPPADKIRSVVVRRIRFVPKPPAGAKPLRKYTQPRPCSAVEEGGDFGLIPAAVWPEPIDRLDVVLVAPGGVEPGAGWLAPPNHPDAPSAVTIQKNGIAVHWRPGRALIRAPADQFDELLTALADFAFYEGELRTLERHVEAGEDTAAVDTGRAYHIQARDRTHWSRFAALIVHFGSLRMAYARLEPRLVMPSRSLPPSSRGLVNRLFAKADIEARLESLSNRLEACEDLYEGATDRVADYRWYRTGHWLEWGIIFLLVLEVALISADLYLRHFE